LPPANPPGGSRFGDTSFASAKKIPIAFTARPEMPGAATQDLSVDTHSSHAHRQHLQTCLIHRGRLSRVCPNHLIRGSAIFAAWTL
jgi:hypothetical protein